MLAFGTDLNEGRVAIQSDDITSCPSLRSRSYLSFTPHCQTRGDIPGRINELRTVSNTCSVASEEDANVIESIVGENEDEEGRFRYETKWRSGETTWEPAESFIDPGNLKLPFYPLICRWLRHIRVDSICPQR